MRTATVRMLLVVPVSIGAASSSSAQSANAERGAEAFKACRACHIVGDPPKHAVGPALNNVAGRKAGSAEGYAYSANMTELGAGGLVWSDQNLDRYLENPKAVVPNGKMVFPGLKDAQNRADVIAHLKSLGKP